MSDPSCVSIKAACFLKSMLTHLRLDAFNLAKKVQPSQRGRLTHKAHNYTQVCVRIKLPSTADCLLQFVTPQKWPC